MERRSGTFNGGVALWGGEPAERAVGRLVDSGGCVVFPFGPDEVNLWEIEFDENGKSGRLTLKLQDERVTGYRFDADDFQNIVNF